APCCSWPATRRRTSPGPCSRWTAGGRRSKHRLGGGGARMAQRHTVYLKRSAARVTPERLLAGIQEVDLGLIAEVCDVPDERVEEALEHLRIENLQPPGFVFYRLYYRPGQVRQVDVQRWRSRVEIRGVIEEVIENLDPKAAVSKKVRRYLKSCVDTVSASYGSSMPGEAMAPILASEVCRWLAEKSGGIIHDPCGDWYELGEWPDLKPL